MTTDEVLTKIFAIRGGFVRFGIEPSLWRLMRKRFKDKKSISLENKIKLIKKCGGKINLDIDWDIDL
jgi:hypothetical protein